MLPWKPGQGCSGCSLPGSLPWFPMGWVVTMSLLSHRTLVRRKWVNPRGLHPVLQPHWGLLWAVPPAGGLGAAWRGVLPPLLPHSPQVSPKGEQLGAAARAAMGSLWLEVFENH